MRYLRILTSVLAIATASGWARGDYSVQVDLKNTTGEAKVNWPVALKVYTVLGRNLPAGSVNREGFHVVDPGGAEVAHRIEKVPPYDRPGNDEIIFMIPKID
ncbi:hypothetical protein LCGC14_2162300, partial [marine sediment metagenome]